ncbi:hypothetical protein BDV09DRAFT_160198 [Aspergillus tetrazonus]
MVHLPSSTYATIWYALLCLSKLSLLFHADEHGSIGLDKRAIHSRGVGLYRGLTSFLLGMIELHWYARMDRGQRGYGAVLFHGAVN